MKTRLIRLSSLLLAFGLLIGCGQSYIRSDDGKHKLATDKIYNSWKVYDFKAGGRITAMTSDQARSLINSNIVLQKSKINYFGKSCENLNYRYKFSGSADVFFKEGSKKVRLLGLENKKIDVVEARCKDATGITLISISNTNRGIFIYRGMYFYTRIQDRVGWFRWIW